MKLPINILKNLPRHTCQTEKIARKHDIEQANVKYETQIEKLEEL